MSALRDEVAALMSSDGDSEKKIALLKKAVVNAAKQKQELTAQNAQLAGDLANARQELTGSREENLKLHRRVTTLEGELEQERRRGTNFGQNFMKGLSSLVAGGEESHGAEGGSAGAAGARAGAAGSRSQGLPLSAEDVERVVKENEKLLMQVYSLKSQHEESRARAREERHRLEAELAEQAKEVAGQRSLLEATTTACDRLNADCARYRALVAFCRHFFALHAETPAGGDVRFRIAPALPSLGAGAAGVAPEMRAAVVDGACEHVATLLDGVSVLLTTLRETLPRAQRATVGDLRLFSDRLAALQEAHTIAKVSIVHHVKTIQESLSPPSPSHSSDVAGAADGDAVVGVAVDAAAALLEWCGLIRSHAALLADSCVEALPPGGAYVLLGAWPEEHPGDDGVAEAAVEGAHRELREREAFVEEAAALLSAFLGDVEGAVEALLVLLRSARAEAVVAAAGSADWLCALLWFWWDGATAAPALRAAAGSLALVVRSVARACGTGHVREALGYVARRVKAFDRDEPRHPAAAMGPAALSTLSATCRHCGAPGRDGLLRGGGTAALDALAADIAATSGNQELLHALAAADRAAASYWTQMNETTLELAEKEDQLQEARDDLLVARAQLAECAAQASMERGAFLEKIQLLSDQVVQLTPHSGPPQQQRRSA